METYRLGPITLGWSEGDLRYLRHGRLELLRRVYGAVRDTTWGTVPARVELLERELTDHTLRLVWASEHRQGDIAFTRQGTLAVVVEEVDGGWRLDVEYTFDGQAETTFATNRTGLCMLHPATGFAGSAVRVYHAGGGMTDALWPEQVAPHQPLTDIASLTWWPSWLDVRVEFEGEVFETEDQRNWSDGSYKTYSRPLSQPFPYTLAAGERVVQRVRLSAVGPATEAPDRVSVTVGAPRGRMPALGLRGGMLDYARIDLHLVDGVLPMVPGGPLEIGLHLPADGDAGLAEAAQWLVGQQVERIIVYRDGQTMAGPDDVALVRAAVGGGAPIGPGTVGSFAELNRRRPERPVDLLGWPICPQVHATDDLSLIENLQGIGPTVATARAFAPEARLCVGPLLFWRRPDPFAAGCAGVDDGSAPPDPRLRQPLGAVWTLGAVAALAEAGAGCVTLYDADGPFALADEALLATLARLAGGQVRAVTVSDPLRVTALAVAAGDRTHVLVANLTDAPLSVAVAGETLHLGSYDWREWESAGE